MFAVNDGAVMKAWAEDQKTEGSMIRLLGDPRSDLTKKLDTVLNHPGPMAKLGYNRCQRISMYIDNCKVKTFQRANEDDDPAGDDKPEVTLVEQMVKDLDALAAKSEL